MDLGGLCGRQKTIFFTHIMYPLFLSVLHAGAQRDSFQHGRNKSITHEGLAQGGYQTDFLCFGATKHPAHFLPLFTFLPVAFLNMEMHFIERKEERNYGPMCRGEFLEDFQQESSVWPDIGLEAGVGTEPGHPRYHPSGHQLSRVHTLQPQVSLHPSLAIVWDPLRFPPQLLPNGPLLIIQFVHILETI